MPPTTAARQEAPYRCEKANEDEQQESSGYELEMLALRKHGPNPPRLMRPRDLVLEDQELPIFCPLLRARLNTDVEEVAWYKAVKADAAKAKTMAEVEAIYIDLKMGLS